MLSFFPMNSRRIRGSWVCQVERLVLPHFWHNRNLFWVIECYARTCNLKGEGVLLYIKNNLKTRSNSFFALCGKTLFVLVYRPPNVFLRFNNQLICLLRSTWNYYIHKVIMGDSMLICRSHTPPISVKIIDTGPSHHTATGDTWIDFFLTDQCDSVRKHSRTPSTFPSRHIGPSFSFSQMKWT